MPRPEKEQRQQPSDRPTQQNQWQQDAAAIAGFGHVRGRLFGFLWVQGNGLAFIVDIGVGGNLLAVTVQRLEHNNIGSCCR